MKKCKKKNTLKYAKICTRHFCLLIIFRLKDMKNEFIFNSTIKISIIIKYKQNNI